MQILVHYKDTMGVLARPTSRSQRIAFNHITCPSYQKDAQETKGATYGRVHRRKLQIHLQV